MPSRSIFVASLYVLYCAAAATGQQSARPCLYSIFSHRLFSVLFCNADLLLACVQKCWDYTQYVSDCMGDTTCLCEDSEFQNVCIPSSSIFALCSGLTSIAKYRPFISVSTRNAKRRFSQTRFITPLPCALLGLARTTSTATHQHLSDRKLPATSVIYLGVLYRLQIHRRTPVP